MSHAAHDNHAADAHATDPWHDHAGEAPPQETHGETNPAFIALVGAVGMIIIVVLIVILTKYFDSVVLSEKIAKQEQWDVQTEYRAVDAQWNQNLSSYAWSDPQAGTVRIPIDRAIEAVSSEYAAGQ